MNLRFKLNTRLKKGTSGTVFTLLLLLVLVIGCEDEKQKPKYNPPESHSIKKDGHMHLSGLNQPLTNCTSCHGDDLTGGSSGVSCFECHKKEW